MPKLTKILTQLINEKVESLVHVTDSHASIAYLSIGTVISFCTHELKLMLL